MRENTLILQFISKSFIKHFYLDNEVLKVYIKETCDLRK